VDGGRWTVDGGRRLLIVVFEFEAAELSSVAVLSLQSSVLSRAEGVPFTGLLAYRLTGYWPLAYGRRANGLEKEPVEQDRFFSAFRVIIAVACQRLLTL
jgi:hypothetical protein